MSAQQRYVSSEMTHFVGRNLPEADQYQLLIEIIASGWLTHAPHNPAISGQLTVNTNARMSENEMYFPQIISFSDIPIGELDIHIRKYSRFGLSFLKSFLVEQGANPVFYICKNASSRDKGRTQRITLGERFDRVVHEYHLLFKELQASGEKSEDAHHLKQLLSIKEFLDYHIFSFLKFFDESKPDDAPENFYMEREWRILGNLQFTVDHIRRIILPESYAARLRADLPKYVGQITFIE
ncbi:MAG: hypothetical protein HY282_07855 [Nitrospirae bacterium]|nr:hypothetical protein [Candidatus Manganitrophaceae bacterium]